MRVLFFQVKYTTFVWHTFINFQWSSKDWPAPFCKHKEIGIVVLYSILSFRNLIFLRYIFLAQATVSSYCFHQLNYRGLSQRPVRLMFNHVLQTYFLKYNTVQVFRLVSAFFPFIHIYIDLNYRFLCTTYVKLTFNKKKNCYKSFKLFFELQIISLGYHKQNFPVHFWFENKLSNF